MARPFVCDACGYQQPSPLAFEVDGDDNQVTVELHLCSAQCLSDFAMGLSLDFPDDAA